MRTKYLLIAALVGLAGCSPYISTKVSTATDTHYTFEDDISACGAVHLESEGRWEAWAMASVRGNYATRSQAESAVEAVCVVK